MATTRYSSSSNDLRRQVGSPRSKGRENKDTTCRNILIYGHCRYEDQGCTFNHEPSKSSPSPAELKKPFNVESPSFTPSQPPAKKSTFSSQAASAAPFTPRGVNSTPTLPAFSQNVETTVLNPGAIREFTPQNYDVGNSSTANSVAQDNGLYNDPFASLSSLGQGLPPSSSFHPYASDHNAMGGSGAGYYSAQFPPGGLVTPPSYHLYQPFDSYRKELQPWQRSTYDFFVPDKLREEMQKKMFAMQQQLPMPGTLPRLDHYFALFPLDTTNRKNTASFGYPSWMYKAMSSRNGRYFALRRLEGYRLTNENAVLSVVKDWKRVKNANIVSVHEMFTTREFGDSSLIFVYDYHPNSKTLLEQHPQANARYRGAQPVPEQVLWSYICQIANALKAIHSFNLAARCLEPSKIIVDKNRIRLAACSILDVVNFESNKRPVQELQMEDLVKFGKVILSLATATPMSRLDVSSALESLTPKYSTTLKEALTWLILPGPGEFKTIHSFIGGISNQLADFLDLAFHDRDEIYSQFARELENGRVARIMMKLAAINDREGVPGNPEWSNTGDRYQLKLFRDYVFHQVDAEGKPVLSIGHMLSCLNKLDAGTDELVMLISRDEKMVYVPSYRELKQMLDRSFNELVKLSKHGASGAN
ncbi:PAB-dependent poly(A)-specific ribonuclease subunit PAN3 [Echria macrotheca]|uniref:PAN2-PAN3 deadenylation complex subunit PAN3 n=1 Tax=Echria macrotheca TaxID=438768 RepID=A0AAJ0BK69_9PEZI|nr:PAB-dependent poly(A)-specific ribonuclease subunit PAN3 [Echria macrotheca]